MDELGRCPRPARWARRVAVARFPVYRLEEKRDSLATAYRWHVADPVPYNEQIDVKLEHGLVNRRNADYRTVGFYYEAAP